MLLKITIGLVKLTNIHYSICILDLRPDEMLTFYVDETEVMDLETEPGVHFAVHSPFEAENPLMKGEFLKVGRTYNLYVEMVSSQTL